MVVETGRYQSVDVASGVDAAGRAVPCLGRRFLPKTMGTTIASVTVTDGTRLDLVAMRWLGDTTAFWRVADANQAMDPTGLTIQLGRTLVVRQPAS